MACGSSQKARRVTDRFPAVEKDHEPVETEGGRPHRRRQRHETRPVEALESPASHRIRTGQLLDDLVDVDIADALTEVWR